MERDPNQTYDLQAIFDLSAVLNASLNLKTVLDTLLLTLMGKFMVGKGLVLLSDKKGAHAIETLRGLPHALLGKHVQVDDFPQSPCRVTELNPSPPRAFLSKNGIALLVPIRHDQHELGLVGLGAKGAGVDFSDAELDYLSTLANISATAIQNGLIFRELDSEKRKADKRVQELNTLSEIVRELNATLSTLDSQKVVNLLAYSIMGEMMVNRCLVFLAGAERMLLKLNKGLPPEECSRLEAHPEALGRLAALKEAVRVDDLEPGPVRDAFSEVDLALLIPMRIENETKGVVALGSKITNLPFSQDEINFLSILGDWSVISIETARLIEQELEKKAIEEDLRIASQIQRQLLPETCPALDDFEIAASNTPSKQVGGDYYDCIRVSEEEYIFCIADVSGKGPPAALLMANMQASLHAFVDAKMDIQEIADRINNIIYRNTAFDKFITGFIGLLDLRQRSFTSVNAGHNPPYLFRSANEFTTFDAGGLILGMMPGVSYESETVQLEPGDCIVMFTDGVSEALSAQGEEFEEHRIESCISENFGRPANEILDALLQGVSEFSAGCPQADDITAMILKAK